MFTEAGKKGQREAYCSGIEIPRRPTPTPLLDVLRNKGGYFAGENYLQKGEVRNGEGSGERGDHFV